MLNFNGLIKKFSRRTHYLLLLLIFLAALAGNLALLKHLLTKRSALVAGVQVQNGIKNALIKPVSAEEIYPLFVCPCCGRTIDADCCAMAEERAAFVREQIKSDLSREQIIAAYVKNYGLASFKDKNEADEFKQKLAAQAPADRPIIAVEPASQDLGDVSQKQGAVSTEFTVKNQGRTDLTINKLETSCGCTSASIIYQGKESPIFSMPGHGINEELTGWQVSVAAGDTARLKVYYDPGMHPDFRGLAIREIYVYSNDPVDFEAKVKIELNQTD